MTPIDVATGAAVLAWHGLVVIAVETTQLSSMDARGRVIYGLELGVLEAIVTLVGLWVMEAVAVTRWARRQVPMVALMALIHPVMAGGIALVWIVLAITGVWHWWGGVAAMAVAGLMWVVVTDRSMQPDHAPAIDEDEEEA